MTACADFDLQPILIGSSVTLRPLRGDDFDALYSAASDPAIWAQHPDSQRFRLAVFRDRFFTGAMASGGAFAIVENRSGRIVGSTRFYDWRPDLCEVAIGYTFLVRRLWGSGANAQMKQLLLDHAFKQARAVWFHVGEDNLRSRRAVEKLGAIVVREEACEADGAGFTKLHYRLEAPRRTPAGA